MNVSDSTVAIIGTGNIGSTLAANFAAGGQKFLLADREQEKARKLQNTDGSFSTDFFKGREAKQDKQLRINTTGHVFEWLALTLPDHELEAPWVQEAANALAMMILNIGSEPMEGGTLYHAVHGLTLYHARLYDRDKLQQWTFLPLPHWRGHFRHRPLCPLLA